MPITELALLHLPCPSSQLPPSLKSILLTAKQSMESFTSHPFHFYTPLHDPSYIYILGTWESISQHREEWLPSETNRGLVRELQAEGVRVEWMFHLELESNGEEGGRKEMMVIDWLAPLEAPVLGIARYFLKREGKDGFEGELRGKRRFIEEYVSSPRKVVGGWKVEVEGEEEEFVQFTGWESVEAYQGFVESEACKEYLGIKKWTGGAEVSHLVQLAL